jgi:glycosyltransferase involved in cell wall biosynthesis
MRPAAYRAFAEAYRVLYVAEATRRAWRPVETRGNFAVIRHGIPPERLEEEVSRWAPAKARKLLDVPAGKLVVTVVGTVCRRKGQLDLIKAYAALAPETRKLVKIIIAGKLVDPLYVAEFEEILDTLDDPDVVLTDHIEDPFLFYAAADIFVCTSRIESAPRVLVEAMACGLPIVTTPVFGIPEMVQENRNALYYEPGDHAALAELIERLVEDPAHRASLAEQSPRVLQGQPGFPEMVEGYGRVLRQAINLELGNWLN